MKFDVFIFDSVYVADRWEKFSGDNCLNEGDRILFEIVTNEEIPIWRFRVISNVETPIRKFQVV
uniref:TF-B3 domain-containing protein n=1 Tax=Solanum lycopersicum TaxID=4081 RepID=A0A3Q7EYQ8_SOLLC